MKFTVIIFFAVLSTAGFAQNKHSVQIDDGLGAYSIITAPSTGGTFTLPSGGGTLLTSNGGTSSPAWLVGGNTSPSSTLLGNNTALGNLDLRAGNATRLSLNGTSGAVTIPGSVFGVNGVSYTFPAANAVGVMTNNGSGTLSWAPASAGWSLSGNALTGTLPATPTEFFGSSNGADVVMQTNGVEQMRLKSSGGVLLPVTAATGVGVIYQGIYPLIHTFGVGDFFAGRNAGNFTMSGGANTGVGDFAFRANTLGGGNTAVGTSTLTGNTQGSNNSALGTYSLYSNTIGGNNTVSGYSAMESNTTASQNVAIGRNALYTQSFANGGVAWSSNNTAIGFEALYLNQPTTTSTGNNNTSLGYKALRSNVTGTTNSALGYQADVASGALTNATAIGANAIVDVSNKIQLGDGSVTLVNTSGDYQTGLGKKVIFRNPAGTFNSTFAAGAQTAVLDYTLPIVAPTAGQMLSSDAAGVMSWTTASALSGGVNNTIPKWTSASTLGNSALTDNGTTLSYNFFFTLTSGQITTLGASFSNTSSNGRIVAITNNDNNSGLGNSRGLDINIPNGAGAGNTYTGIKFNVVAGAGIANDLLGTSSNWKITSAGAATLAGLNGAAANKYAEHHTVTAGEIAGNTVTIANSIVAGATSVVVATFVSNGAGGTATMAKKVVAAASSVAITFDNAPVAGDVVNYIVVNP